MEKINPVQLAENYKAGSMKLINFAWPETRIDRHYSRKTDAKQKIEEEGESWLEKQIDEYSHIKDPEKDQREIFAVVSSDRRLITYGKVGFFKSLYYRGRFGAYTWANLKMNAVICYYERMPDACKSDEDKRQVE